MDWRPFADIFREYRRRQDKDKRNNGQKFEKVSDYKEKQYKGLYRRLFPLLALYGACIILENIDRRPVFVDDTERYKAYLFDAATPVLYVDNIANVIDHLMRISDYTQRQLAGKDIEELKDMRDAIVAERKEAVIKAQVTEIKS